MSSKELFIVRHLDDKGILGYFARKAAKKYAVI